MAVDIRDVAARAGVSATTVSHVLNGTRRVSAATQERVRRAVAELDYRPNALARGLKLRRTHTVGVVVPDLYSSFFPALVHSVERHLEAHGFTFLLGHSGGSGARELKHLRDLVARGVDGLILATARGDEPPPPWLRGTPIVYVDRPAPAGVEAVSVITANRSGARAAVEALLRSYPAVAVAAAYPRSNPSLQRIEGYRDAVQAAGAGFISAIEPGDRGRDGVRAQVARLLQRLRPPFGLFCTTNASLLGAVVALKEAGLRWPQDVGLIGFGDADWNRIVDPPISAVRTFPDQIGRLAVDELMRAMEGRPGPAGVREVPGELIERASSRGPGAG